MQENNRDSKKDSRDAGGVSRVRGSGGRRSRSGRSGKPRANVPSLLWRTLNFRCSFCLKIMQPLEMNALEKLRYVLGFRRHSCPHCFDTHVLPCHYMKYLLFPFRFMYLAFMEDDDD
jgi:hypothetical protein